MEFVYIALMTNNLNKFCAERFSVVLPESVKELPRNEREKQADEQAKIQISLFCKQNDFEYHDFYVEDIVEA